jgi:hypothetical protein|tara:strand:+ start:891 stop:1070 length:180 start_codon:yes stop_codon:yes gene_type:complete
MDFMSRLGKLARCNQEVGLVDESQEARQDRRADIIGIVVILTAALLMVAHFISGWVPGG